METSHNIKKILILVIEWFNRRHSTLESFPSATKNVSLHAMAHSIRELLLAILWVGTPLPRVQILIRLGNLHGHF